MIYSSIGMAGQTVECLVDHSLTVHYLCIFPIQIPLVSVLPFTVTISNLPLFTSLFTTLFVFSVTGSAQYWRGNNPEPY